MARQINLTGTVEVGPTGPREDGLSKYTVLFDRDTALALDGLALDARRAAGHRVDKSALLRALIRLADENPALRAQLIAETTRA